MKSLYTIGFDTLCGYQDAPSISDVSNGLGYLKYGMKGDSVKTLQGYLGFWDNIDGIFGQVTYDAVRAFQRNNNLNDDGIVGKGTITQLLVKRSMGDAGYTASTPTGKQLDPFARPSGSLQWSDGSTINLGSRVSGGWGSGAITAVNPVLSSVTVTLDNGTVFDVPVQGKLSTGIRTAVAGEDILGSFTPAPTLDDVRAGKAYISNGQQGDAVAYVQRALGVSPPDGKFGNDTETAVKKFQASLGVEQAGYIGANTLVSIDKKVSSGATEDRGNAIPTVQPAYTPSSSYKASKTGVPMSVALPGSAPGAADAPVSFFNKPVPGLNVPVWQAGLGAVALGLVGYGVFGGKSA